MNVMLLSAGLLFSSLTCVLGNVNRCPVHEKLTAGESDLKVKTWFVRLFLSLSLVFTSLSRMGLCFYL